MHDRSCADDVALWHALTSPPYTDIKGNISVKKEAGDRRLRKLCVY